MTQRRVNTVVSLGIAQTLAWASSYYLPAILAPSMARDLGVSTPTVFAGFSAALVVSAILGRLRAEPSTALAAGQFWPPTALSLQPASLCWRWRRG